MNWKQPVPTQVPEVMGDSFAETVYQKLVIRAKNIDGNVYVKDTFIFLKRGQCVIGRFELAECFGLKRNEAGRIRICISKLVKVYNLITIQKSRNCSIVTIINYDEVTSFDQSNEQSTTNQKPIKDQSKTTNKNDKNVKNEKNNTYLGKNPQTPVSYPDKEEIKQAEVVRPKDKYGRTIISLGWELMSDEEAQKRLEDNPSWKMKKTGRIHDTANGWKEVCMSPEEHALLTAKDPMDLVRLVEEQLGNVIRREK